MGARFSNATKVRRSSSSSKPEEQEKKSPNGKDHQNSKPRLRDRGQMNRAVSSKKRIDFGYSKEFERQYEIGKLLGHGHFGYTFVATDRANGERVAVKRISKNKVVFLCSILSWGSKIWLLTDNFTL